MKEVYITLQRVPTESLEALRKIFTDHAALVECEFQDAPIDDTTSNLYVTALADLRNYQLKNGFLKEVSPQVWEEIGDICPVRVLPKGCVVAGVAGLTGAQKYEVAVGSSE